MAEYSVEVTLRVKLEAPTAYEAWEQAFNHAREIVSDDFSYADVREIDNAYNPSRIRETLASMAKRRAK
jgi:predicted aminopeptidase